MIAALYSSFFAIVLFGALVMLAIQVRRDWPRISAALQGDVFQTAKPAAYIRATRARRADALRWPVIRSKHQRSFRAYRSANSRSDITR